MLCRCPSAGDCELLAEMAYCGKGDAFGLWRLACGGLVAREERGRIPAAEGMDRAGGAICC